MAAVLKQLASLNLTAAGTAQAFSATPIIAQTVILNAKTGNTGLIYVGDADVDATNAAFSLAAGETVIVHMPVISGGNADTDLSKWFFDGGTTNDDLLVGYIQRTN